MRVARNGSKVTVLIGGGRQRLVAAIVVVVVFEGSLLETIAGINGC